MNKTNDYSAFGFKRIVLQLSKREIETLKRAAAIAREIRGHIDDEFAPWDDHAADAQHGCDALTSGKIILQEEELDDPLKIKRLQKLGYQQEAQ